MRTVMTVLLSLVLMACTPGGSRDDEAEQAAQLEAARQRVLDDVTPVLDDLVATLPGRVRFSQGNYDACENNLSGATAVTYRVNGRLDLTGGPADLDAVLAALTRAGFADDGARDAITAAGTKDGTKASFSRLEGEPALLFAAGDDGCYRVGGDRARDLPADRNPIAPG
jgi:hypothetical protein